MAAAFPGPGEGDLGALRCRFAAVQALPASQRPRALEELLRALTGTEIDALLADAASAASSSKLGSSGLLAAVVRAGPALPGFRDVCLLRLLLPSTQGCDCALGVLLAGSPAADEAVAAYFRAGYEHELLEWALCSPDASALIRCLCESISRLDRAHLELGVPLLSSEEAGSAQHDVSGENRARKMKRDIGSCRCVVDAFVHVSCQPQWTILETALLSSALQNLRETSMRELRMRHDVHTARALLERAHRRLLPCAPGNKRALHGIDAGHDCCHEHLVEGLIEGLGGELEPGSSEALFFADMVRGMSLAQVSASLELLNSAEARGARGMLERGVGSRCGVVSGQATLRLFARAASCILDETAPSQASGRAVGEESCLLLQHQGLELIDVALERLFHSAMSDVYLRVFLAKGGAVGRGGQKLSSVLTVQDAASFQQACAVLGLLTSSGGCMAGASTSSAHALRSLHRIVARFCGAEDAGSWCGQAAGIDKSGEGAELDPRQAGDVAADIAGRQVSLARTITVCACMGRGEEMNCR